MNSSYEAEKSNDKDDRSSEEEIVENTTKQKRNRAKKKKNKAKNKSKFGKMEPLMSNIDQKIKTLEVMMTKKVEEPSAL